MSYALATLWYERQRFFPGVLAVAFSALLIALQCGLLLGLFSITSIPIDMSKADIWVGHPEVPSVDLGRPIPEPWLAYLAGPEIERIEPYMEGFAYWSKPTGGMELCIVIGSRLQEDSLGRAQAIDPGTSSALAEPGAVIIDESEFERLGIAKVGDTAEVVGRRVRVMGTVSGLKSLAGPYVFCSVDTAKTLLRPPPNQVTFLLAKCYNSADAPKVVERLRNYPMKVSAFTAEDFSFRSRWHWLTKTKAGVALSLAAFLGLLVGTVVTYQTLKAATLASLKEFAVLRALGIPRWRMSMAVLSQSFWVGAAGIVFAIPSVFLIARLAAEIGAKIILPWWLIVASTIITMIMALLSGLLALRALRQVEPVSLLR
ncbi:MAG: ABC transporter permease [Gemmataceae bacterium]